MGQALLRMKLFCPSQYLDRNQQIFCTWTGLILINQAVINTDKSYLPCPYVSSAYSMYPRCILQDGFKLIFLLQNKFLTLLQSFPILFVNMH